MAQELIIEKTLIDERVTVLTVDSVEDHEVIGLHATLKTFVIGVPDINPHFARVAYKGEAQARIGHGQIVTEIKRDIIKREAVEIHGVSKTVVEGWL